MEVAVGPNRRRRTGRSLGKLKHHYTTAPLQNLFVELRIRL
jgi:hypothetical protein